MADSKVCSHCGAALGSPVLADAGRDQPADELSLALFGVPPSDARSAENLPPVQAPSSVSPGSPEAPSPWLDPPFQPLDVGAIDDQTRHDAATTKPHADDLERAEPPGSAWPTALLAGYASAVTLALLWLWSSGDRRVDARPAGGTASDAASRPVDRINAAFEVEPPAELPDDRQLMIGESIRIGSVEVMPTLIKADPVVLRRARMDGTTEEVWVGGGALWLELEVRNLSSTLVFAPIDDEMVREADHRLPYSFVEDLDGFRIYSYRLPMRDAARIAGQEFRVLRPGESARINVVTDIDAVNRVRGPLTWRVRFRAEPDRPEEIEVVFDASDVRRTKERADAH